MDEQVLINQQTIKLLLLLNMSLVLTNILLSLVMVVAGFNARRTLLDILSTIRDMLRQCQMYLQMGKQYSESARIHQNQTERAIQEVKQVAQIAPEIAEAVATVPEKTATKVVDKLKSSSDSGTF